MVLKRKRILAKGYYKEQAATVRCWLGKDPRSSSGRKSQRASEGEQAEFVVDLDFSATTDGWSDGLKYKIKEGRGQPISLTEEEMRQGLRRFKAHGPDFI